MYFVLSPSFYMYKHRTCISICTLSAIAKHGARQSALAQWLGMLPSMPFQNYSVIKNSRGDIVNICVLIFLTCIVGEVGCLRQHKPICRCRPRRLRKEIYIMMGSLRHNGEFIKKIYRPMYIYVWVHHKCHTLCNILFPKKSHNDAISFYLQILSVSHCKYHMYFTWFGDKCRVRGLWRDWR